MHGFSIVAVYTVCVSVSVHPPDQPICSQLCKVLSFATLHCIHVESNWHMRRYIFVLPIRILCVWRAETKRIIYTDYVVLFKTCNGYLSCVCYFVASYKFSFSTHHYFRCCFFAEVYIYITTGTMYSIIYACVNTFILQVAIVQNSLVWRWTDCMPTLNMVSLGNK